MAELLKAYPKDVALVIEIPLKELEDLLDYLDRARVEFDGVQEPEFKEKASKANELILSLGQMADSVRNYPNA